MACQEALDVLDLGDLSQKEKLALLGVVLTADENGVAELNTKVVALRMSAHYDTARRAIRDLERKGYLAVEPRAGRGITARLQNPRPCTDRDQTLQKPRPDPAQTATRSRNLPQSAPPQTPPWGKTPTPPLNPPAVTSPGAGENLDEEGRNNVTPMPSRPNAQRGQLEAMAERLTGACTGNNRRFVAQEACDVVVWATRFVDARTVDEAIGRALAWDDRPTLPRAIAPRLAGEASKVGVRMDRFQPRQPVESHA